MKPVWGQAQHGNGDTTDVNRMPPSTMRRIHKQCDTFGIARIRNRLQGLNTPPFGNRQGQAHHERMTLNLLQQWVQHGQSMHIHRQFSTSAAPSLGHRITQAHGRRIASRTEPVALNTLHGQGVAHDSQMIGLEIALGEVNLLRRVCSDHGSDFLSRFPVGLASLFCRKVGCVRAAMTFFQKGQHGLQYFGTQRSACRGIKKDSMIKRFHLIAAKKTPAESSIFVVASNAGLKTFTLSSDAEWQKSISGTRHSMD